MSEEKKFREFWVTQSIKSGQIRSVIESDTEFVGYKNIHVIEHAALEAERAKSKKLVEALADSTISYDRMAMIKAIKDYEASDD